jgi:hypothetical protein
MLLFEGVRPTGVVWSLADDETFRSVREAVAPMGTLITPGAELEAVATTFLSEEFALDGLLLEGLCTVGEPEEKLALLGLFSPTSPLEEPEALE